ncbi:hypothetical protein Tdes44962_MAKER00960 [Teratosphaeria destructans]|uniref:Uncharacterized protein n=1 Tax=Teratosphaeria destructans TaxID=418781 RepID=A0A9W7SJE4_9PEZI|nr:hypothetical protein Tdes44962_MAKER00960 [Teratosphaeria destructans]
MQSMVFIYIHVFALLCNALIHFILLFWMYQLAETRALLQHVQRIVTDACVREILCDQRRSQLGYQYGLHKARHSAEYPGAGEKRGGRFVGSDVGGEVR